MSVKTDMPVPDLVHAMEFQSTHDLGPTVASVSWWLDVGQGDGNGRARSRFVSLGEQPSTPTIPFVLPLQISYARSCGDECSQLKPESHATFVACT